MSDNKTESAPSAYQKLLDELPRLPPSLPLTLIYGELDRVVPLSAEQIKAVAPGPCDAFIVDGASHHAYCTHAADFHAALLSGLPGDLQPKSNATVATSRR